MLGENNIDVSHIIFIKEHIMKKIISMILAVFICTGLFTGCTTSSAFKDGTYKAEFATPDDHGWTDYVEVTVTNAKITGVVFDAKNGEGAKKSEDKGYEEAMKGAGSKTWPSDFYPKLANGLIEKQDPTKVDNVAGATTSSNDFKTLVRALEKKMTNGDTSVEVVKR